MSNVWDAISAFLEAHEANSELLATGDWMDLASALTQREDRVGELYILNRDNTGIGMLRINLVVELEPGVFPTLLEVFTNTESDGRVYDKALTKQLNELIMVSVGGVW